MVVVLAEVVEVWYRLPRPLRRVAIATCSVSLFSCGSPLQAGPPKPSITHTHTFSSFSGHHWHISSIFPLCFNLVAGPFLKDKEQDSYCPFSTMSFRTFIQSPFTSESCNCKLLVRKLYSASSLQMSFSSTWLHTMIWDMMNVDLSNPCNI